MHPDVSVWCFLGYFIAALGAGIGWNLGGRIVARLFDGRP